MNIEELYAKKGRLTTNLEIIQAQLREVNQQLIEEINKQNQANVVSEVKKDAKAK